MDLETQIDAAVGGAYEMPDGRQFWIDAPVAREIARRAAEALRETRPDFPRMEAAMREAMESHPWWTKAQGTPLANDIPVRAAETALRVFLG